MHRGPGVAVSKVPDFEWILIKRALTRLGIERSRFPGIPLQADSRLKDLDGFLPSDAH